jgi:tetratricopeptide (TPR) repeat protein
MPEFLFRARTPDGADLHERIEAANLGQARYMLEIRGYREIEFLTDEHIGDIRRATLSGTTDTIDPDLWTAEDEVAAARRKGAAAHFWWAFRQHLVILAPLLVWNLFSFRGGRPYGWLDWLGFAATPIYLGYFLVLALPMVLFQMLLEASAWHDWVRVRRCVRVARGLRTLGIAGIPESELDFRDAYALAAQQRVDEAVRSLDKYRGHPEMAPYIFLSRVASVYEYAGRYDRMIALLEEAAAKGPGGVSEWIDVAMARVRYVGDVAGARAALQRLDDKEIPELAGTVLMECLGIIACEEGDFEQARDLFNGALERFGGNSGNPLIQVFIAEVKAYLVVCLVALGDKPLAKNYFAEIRPLLVAREDRRLLERCEAALMR